jgi:hypothetical protein
MKIAERPAECPVDKSAKCWLGRQDSNLRMAVPKTAALPLGYAPAAVFPLRGEARLIVIRSAGSSVARGRGEG